MGVVGVRLVSQYRHPGGLLHHSGQLVREARHRVALAYEAFEKHKRRIFSSPLISFAAKSTLYESLVLSVLLYGVGSWSKPDPASLGVLERAHVLMAAKMLRPKFSFEDALRLGSGRILSLLGLPSIEVLVHTARLRGI